MGGNDAAFTASTSGSDLPNRNNTAEDHRNHDPGDWPDHNSRSSNNHPNDASGNPQAAVSGRDCCPQPRSRGRPPGSRNKPKPLVALTPQSPGALRFHVLHVASGADVAGVVASFARRRRVGVVILSCSGFVANVALREPPPDVASITIPGRYEILSLRGCFLPEQSPQGVATGLAVYFSAGWGQVLGGNVVGPMKASGPVMLVVATFSPSTATYDWLSPEDAQPSGRATAGGAGEGVQLHQSLGANAGGSGGRWTSSSDPAALAAPMPVYNLRPHHVGNTDQIPDAEFADSWPSSAARPPAPPSNHK